MGFKEDLISVASDELQLWHAGGWKECMGGHPDPGSERVAKYWQDALSIQRNGCVDVAWSAAFICYCLKKAGMPAAEFPFAEGHSRYIEWAISNTKQDKPGKTYYGRPLTHPPKPGDLIAEWRKAHSNDPDPVPPITFDHQPNDFYPAHCNIVVEATANLISTIGGNVSNKVSLTRYDAHGGILTPKHTLICVLECVKS